MLIQFLWPKWTFELFRVNKDVWGDRYAHACETSETSEDREKVW